MRRLAAFILALGVWQGRTAAAGNDPERFAVPLGGPSRGSANSKVTIVEWADFQCPFSSRVSATLEQIARTYLGEVQFFFRHNPLPHHKDAALAAEAAIAAEAQGRFCWFANSLSCICLLTARHATLDSLVEPTLVQ